MKLNIKIILIFILFYVKGAIAQNAPVSEMDDYASYIPTVTIPVTVTDFDNIGSCNLQILYDSTVATCVSVNLGPGVAGGIASNLTVPGVITIGWYTWPGINLDDGAVLFDLQFSREDFGYTDLTWDNNYYDRQWSDGNFVQLNDQPTSSFYLDGSINFLTENAPLTIAPDIVGIPGETISVPITVNDFINIGSFALSLTYNNTVLTYQSFTNNSGFPGITVDGSVSGTISTSGLVDPGNSGFFLSDNDTLFTLSFSYQGGTTDLIWDNTGSLSQYAGYPDYNVLIDSPTASFYVNGSVKEAIQLGITVFLEGPFEGSEMTISLKDNNLLPLSQPYSSSPWFYNGDESVATIPDDVVDWVLIELRETQGDASTATSGNVIARQAGFLMKNGAVKSMDGIANMRFPVSPTQNLFVLIYHRNHIAVISANPVPLLNGIGIYNFSTGEFQVYGGIAGHKELYPGTWGLAAGDSNADGIINLLDKQNNWEINTGKPGYLSPDFSMDGQVNNLDKNDFWFPNFDFNSQVP